MVNCCEDCVCNPNFVNQYLETTKNPSKDYMRYMDKVKENFDDFFLRQIYFVLAKLSLRKYYPEKALIIDKVRSEKLTMHQLNKYIKLLQKG